MSRASEKERGEGGVFLGLTFRQEGLTVPS